MKAGQLFGELSLALHGRDSIQVRLDRGDSLGVDLRLVHTRSVVVTDFLLRGTALGIVGGGFFEDVAHHRLVPNH